MTTKMRIPYLASILLTPVLLGFFIPTIQVMAQSTATVSGTIRYSDNPVAGVWVHIGWNNGESEREITTGGDGSYAVSNVPTGGRVNIQVRPPKEKRLADRNWGTELTGNLVKNFDLERGFRLSGEFHQPDGAAYSRSFWLGALPIDIFPQESEWIGNSAENGRFEMIVPPAVYKLDAGRRLLPYYIPTTMIDLKGGDVTGLVITLLTEPEPPFPTAPPNASLITVGPPNIEGYATIIGAPGAVAPLSAVAVINLSANNLITTTAGGDGAFSASLYAPPGSDLLVKYDAGNRVAQLWKEAQGRTLPTASYMNALPGTILRVGSLPSRGAASQTFDSVDYFLVDSPKAWAGWWLSGTLTVPTGGTSPGLTVSPGQQVRLTARLRVTSPALNCTGTPAFTIGADLNLRYLFGADGHDKPWGMWFNAHLFTPTGLPIEKQGQGENRGLRPGDFTSMTCVSAHAFDALLETTFTIPSDLPDGLYRPQVWIENGGVPLAADVPATTVWYRNGGSVASLPIIRIGSPATPHIPWTLLGDYPVNGQRGVQAREDAGRYAMPTRTVFQPEKVVIPRLDERTGKPLAYRLEPSSHWLSASERRQPNPPHVPLSLPSGTLTVRVLKPDGNTETLGPAAIRQSSVRTPTTPGGTDLDEGGGQISDLYHLTTLDDRFAYRFDQDGHHVITLNGEVKDIYGNAYPITGTYDVYVARVLDLDPAQLPTTPYMQGDAFAPGLHLFPPVPADITVRLVHMPNSDPARAITHTITGQANRFGYFQPPAGTEIRFDAPGEFRVDISAVYTDADGTLWMGAVTWGNVVERTNAQIEAHGRRGMDYKSETIDDMPAWFEVFNLPPEKVGVEVYYPYFSGDVHWGNEDRAPGDSIHSIITVRDKSHSQTIYNSMRNHWPRAQSGFRWPPVDTSLNGLNKRLAVGEAPLFMTTDSGIDPAVAPDKIDLWGYWYGTSERPDVRVREIISEDLMGTAYWRFNSTYDYQIGESAEGDLPGDIKWEFGGAVFREPSQGINEYAIYSSLWVLLPHGDPTGARVTPPFQDATGASINGGPVMTLKGQDIDMLFLPKGVRPGDVLELGDVIAFSGHVGPPLDSRVSVTITSPGGVARTSIWHANKIGWIYDPSFDFAANEAGRWTVDVSVVHDRPYVGNGVTPARHNTGTVLGTNGRYEFYVVPKDSPRLSVTSPQPGFLSWLNGRVEPIEIRGVAPANTEAVHYSIHDKGVVMGQGSVTPGAGGNFTIIYDARVLNSEFPFLSLTAHEGLWEGLADEVAINLLAVGSSGPRSNTVTLIGEEVFIGKSVADKSALMLTLPAGGAGAVSTRGAGDSAQAGYATVSLASGAAPYGVAVFSFKQNDVVVSEAAVPASPPTTSARIFIDYRLSVAAMPGRSDTGTVDINTGLAIVNRNSTAANVIYTLRDTTGNTIATGHGSVAGGNHFGKFINQLKDVASDFDIPSDFATKTQFGSLDIVSDQPLSVLALRLTMNQRQEALLTSTPIADLAKPPGNQPLYFPQFADGGGYMTTINLLNTSNSVETGKLAFFDDDGKPLAVSQVGGPRSSVFPYSIWPGGVFVFQTDGLSSAANAGSIQLTPDAGTSSPIGAGIFSFLQGGIRVMESGVPAATPTTHARIYVDQSGSHNTGLAIANPSASANSVTLRAYQTDGSTPAGSSADPLTLEGNGHKARFVSQFISGLPENFIGILDISSSSPFAALTMRSLTNSRGDFLLTTFPIADQNQPASTPIVFPQIADGGGYMTEFILLSSGGASSAILNLYSEDGKPLAVGK
jgi:hypothetical protein